MLADLIRLVAMPAPLDHRRVGCVSDSVRLASRSRRCRAAWAPHLAATREAILASAATAGRRRTAIVLGSGLLDDVPLAELAAGFERVVLVDAVHPWSARRSARRFSNVERLTADLSGSFAFLLGRAETLQSGLPRSARRPRSISSRRSTCCRSCRSDRSSGWRTPADPSARGARRMPTGSGAPSSTPISPSWRRWRRASASSPIWTSAHSTASVARSCGSTSFTARVSARRTGPGTGSSPPSARRSAAGASSTGWSRIATGAGDGAHRVEPPLEHFP